MVQQTFTDMEYANRNRTTKREAFLDAMESIIPWKEWMELIAPFYVQKERGRKLIPLETICACISCRTGSVSRTKESRMQSMTAMP